ncbi:MAG: PRC-barrel domain-containing protein [Methanotrichaceae archaeon]
MHIEITSLLNLDVYTQNGIFVGRVDDAVLDLDGNTIIGLALGHVNKFILDSKGKGAVIPYNWVTAVGNIVLVRHFAIHANKDEKND